MVKSIRIFLLLMAWAVCGNAGALAQTRTEPGLLGGAVRSGIGQFQEKVWGMVSATADNPTNQEITLLMAHQFDNVSNIQFAAEIWIPAHAQRTVWLPVRPGPIAELDMEGNPVRGVALTTLLLNTHGATEQQLSREPGLLPVARAFPLSGVLAGENSDLEVEAAVCMRDASLQSKTMTFLRDQEMPTLHAAWQGLDCLMISSSKLQVDDVQLAALRQWLIAGGHLWILADRVDPVFARRLLGEDWTLQIIDRVPLTDVTIIGRRSEHRRTFEKPVSFVRVLAPGWKVEHTVRGYPAALSRSVGQGSVLVTTLGAQAWLEEIREPMEGSAPSPDPHRFQGKISYKASDPLRELGDDYLRGAERAPLSTREFQRFVAPQIGYRIMDRGPVLGLLGLFCLYLLSMGLWLMRKNRLERIAFHSAGGAVLVSAVLLWLGASHRGEVPLTIASTQFVDVVPSQQHVVITGLMSIYSPQKEQGVIKASKGGLVWTDLPEEPTKPLRTIWTDIDHWYWQNFDLPSGAVLDAPFIKSEALSEPVWAKAQYGPQGLDVKVQTGPFKNLSDLLLVTAAGAMSPRALGPEHYQATTANTLPRGQYLGARGVGFTDVQLRRQEVYRSLLTAVPDLQGRFPRQPVLLGWATPMDLGMTLPAQAKVYDSALVSIPLQFLDSRPGTQVVIPPIFVPFQSVRDQSARLMSSIYNNDNGEWVGKLAQGAVVVLRFQLPAQVLPLKVEAANLTMNIEAAQRTVRLEAYEAGALTAITHLNAPMGRRTISLERLDLLQPDAQGGVFLAIAVEDIPDDTSGSKMWLLDYVDLEVRGTVQER